MGRLIDVDEVKKRLPIMENDWGMVINKSLHNELDKVPTVEAISKVDIMAILDKIKEEIEAEYGYCYICEWYEDYDFEENDISEFQRVGTVSDILEIIDKYKTESEKWLCILCIA